MSMSSAAFESFWHACPGTDPNAFHFRRWPLEAGQVGHRWLSVDTSVGLVDVKVNIDFRIPEIGAGWVCANACIICRCWRRTPQAFAALAPKSAQIDAPSSPHRASTRGSERGAKTISGRTGRSTREFYKNTKAQMRSWNRTEASPGCWWSLLDRSTCGVCNHPRSARYGKWVAIAIW